MSIIKVDYGEIAGGMQKLLDTTVSISGGNTYDTGIKAPSSWIGYSAWQNKYDLVVVIYENNTLFKRVGADVIQFSILSNGNIGVTNSDSKTTSSTPIKIYA